MVDDQRISIFDFLQCNTGFNDENFIIIRELYQQKCNGSFPQTRNETALNEVARQLKIKINTKECRDLLGDCVLTSCISDARILVKATLDANPKRKSLNTVINGMNKHLSHESLDLSPSILMDIDCLITIKMAFPKMFNFIHSFLVQPINETPIHLNANQKSFLLDTRCPLYLFIQEQINECDTSTSIANRRGTRFRLVEPISSYDDFGPWSYDHWQGLFDLELAPHNNKLQFPERWRLAQGTKIHCRIETCNSKEKNSLSSHVDRLRTTTLSAFVHDVCKLEGNNQSASWVQTLEAEDIFSFEHLNNLNQSEWDRIHNLSVNAKRILKMAVNRVRTSTTSEYHRRVIDESNDENSEQTDTSSIEDPSISDSELFAKLHLIKLFIWHKLRDQSAVQRHGALAKLEMKCLELAFKEMQADGFADDGLFPKIREFFLPLTISEKELNLKRSSNQGIRLTKCNELRKNIEQDTFERSKMIRASQKLDKETVVIEELIAENERKSSEILNAWKSKKNNKKQQKQLKALHEAYQESMKCQDDLLQQRHEFRQKRENISKILNELDNKINVTKERLERIEIESKIPHKPVEKQLVKPPRGLILYGPPGTGKSDILTKLAKKLGIVMVGPPLAAGELNRSLVGESERILVALCSRGYQVPYAMCCVSIDEIDSLAPRRNENSSEGKVDKISVLLSLIEGIKDVPNLMFLSATNRLHMMDEAFLRRMSGKFFVGRPSSDARLKILDIIPCWAREPELLVQLSMATTNFSGAAVKALAKEITVKCIDKQRHNPSYQIGEIEALKIADCIAQQYQIFIGSETLPRLLLRNKHLTTHHSNIYHLLADLKYTGRIIVDLYNKHIHIEISNNDQLSIIEHDLYSNETNVQTLLERLTNYGKDRNVQLLQLIDLNLLASQGAYDENKVYETLKDRYNECVSYPLSMIVYDLDALVGVNISESDSSTGLSNTKGIHKQSIYTYVLARFRDPVMEDVEKDGTDKVERWAVVVIREPFLLRQFRIDAQYPRTNHEEEQDELERRKAEDILKCVKCKDFYIENENKIGSCNHHDGFVFDTGATDLEKYTPSQVAIIFRGLERKSIENSKQCEHFESRIKQFKWICCDEIFSNVRTGGCKRGKHGFSVNNSSNRLDQAMIEKWEATCLENEEYNEKWLIIAEEY